MWLGHDRMVNTSLSESTGLVVAFHIAHDGKASFTLGTHMGYFIARVRGTLFRIRQRGGRNAFRQYVIACAMRELGEFEEGRMKRGGYRYHSESTRPIEDRVTANAWNESGAGATLVLALSLGCQVMLDVVVVS